MAKHSIWMAWGFLALAGLSSLSLRSSIVSIFNRTENLSTSAGCRTSATRSNLKEGLATQISQIDTTFGNMIPLTPSLLAGDLPGYTGWARPTETLTPYFRIVPLETDQLAYPNPMPRIASVGQVWTVRVRCVGHSLCMSKERSIFDIRAYGPSVISGKVVPSHAARSKSEQLTDNTTAPEYYDIQMVFPDAGVYQVEVVMAFSKAPDWVEFPLVGPEPNYEGFLLPEFPLTVVANPVELSHKATVNVSNENRRCGNEDLLETSAASAMTNGRWRVSENLRERLSVSPQNISLVSYERGLNSLGITMTYEYQSCKLPPVQAIKETLKDSRVKDWHLLFIGDSNMLAQRNLFRAWQGESNGPHSNATYITTFYGLGKQLPQIREELAAFKKNASAETEFFVLFNAGLHDLGNLCSHGSAGNRYNNGDTRPCVTVYREYMAQFIELVKDFSPKLAVLETTTAGWPKWGNFGFAWPPSKGQPLPLHPSGCQAFNEIAWQEAAKADIPVMDAYWLTVPRPDHREVDNEQMVSKHMVHVGTESYSVLLRKWISLIKIAVENDKPVM